jgi:excisionase family DNA binding protein
MTQAHDTTQPDWLAEFVTQAEAAKLLNLHRDTLRTRVYRGRIGSIKVGATVLIPRSEIVRVQRTYMPD